MSTSSGPQKGHTAATRRMARHYAMQGVLLPMNLNSALTFPTKL